MSLKQVLSGSAVMLLAACGGSKSSQQNGIADGVYSPNNVTLVAPSQPKGSVTGQILTTMLTPLAGAVVTLQYGSQVDGGVSPVAATTDANGNFAFTLVPAGAELLLTATASGYATLRETVVIPASAGNFPIENGNASVGPLTLTQLNGGFKVVILDHNGNPAKGANAIIEARPAGTDLSAGGTYGANMGLVVTSGTADSSGIVAFTGIPAADELSRLEGSYTVTVPALTDSQGVPISAGTVVVYSAQSVLLDPSIRVIQLPQARSSNPLAIAGTNVPALTGATPSPLDSMLVPGSNLFVVFNQAIQPSSLSIILTDEYGVSGLPFTQTLSQDGDVLTITPSTTLQAGQEYNLLIRADSIDNGSFLSATGYFFIGDPNAPTPFGLASGVPGKSGIAFLDSNNDQKLDPGEYVEIFFNQPIGYVDASAISQYLWSYMGADINGSGSIGDGVGETTFSGPGLQTSTFEPVAEKGFLFPLKTSGYTTRWVFQYPPSPTLVSPGATVDIDFSRLPASAGVQTIWGQALTTDIKNTALQILP